MPRAAWLVVCSLAWCALPARAPGPESCALPVEAAARPTRTGTPPWTRVVRCDGAGPPLAGPVRQLFGLRLDAARADAASLEVLPGIGPVRAAALVAARRTHPLCRPSDLERVRGLGPRTRARVAPQLSFDGDPRCGEDPPLLPGAGTHGPLGP